MTILLVDDEYAIVETLRDALESEGYDVVVAANGDQAVERAREAKPQLVLMDIMMPRCDGLTATRRLRDQPDTASIPVALMSAAAPAPDELRTLGNLAGYVRKPFDLERLLRLIAAALAQPALA
jgi:CheY-like chemotaxis protein